MHYIDDPYRTDVPKNLNVKEFMILGENLANLRRRNKERNEKLQITLAELHDEKEKMEEDRNLLRVLSHDVSNPLAIIRSSVAMSKKTKNNPEKNSILWEYCDRATKNLVDTVQLVKEMMSFRDQGKELNLSPQNIEEFFEEAKFIFAERLEEKQLSFNLINSAHHMSFIAEKRSFQSSVFNNIINNAIKFSFNGAEIVVEAYEDAGRYIVKVTDQGTGMTRDQIGVLTDENISNSTAGTGGEKGTGLGFSVIKTYLRIYGGELKIESSTVRENSEDPGTSIILYFSIHRSKKGANAPR